MDGMRYLVSFLVLNIGANEIQHMFRLLRLQSWVLSEIIMQALMQYHHISTCFKKSCLASTTREQSITVSLNISTMQIYVDFNQPNSNNLQPSKESSSSNANRLVVEPPHLKNLLVKLEIFPNFRGELSKKIFETICHHLSDTPGELQIFETNPAKFPFFLMVQPHQASEATNPRLLASDHSDLMHSKLLPNKDCPAHWQPRKTAHEQKNTHFVTREQILRVVFFSTPHQKKNVEQWNYIEIHEINNKMWICELKTRIVNPKSLWMARRTCHDFFSPNSPLRSDLGLSPVEQLQCFFPMSGYTTGADGRCITLSIWLQTKASHPHNSMETKLESITDTQPQLQPWSEVWWNHGQISFWTRDIMNFCLE